MILRIVNVLLGIMFLSFAAVQYNDPDPFLWMLIYCYASVICLLAGIRRYYQLPTMIGTILSFIWFLSLAASILVTIKDYGAGSLFSFHMIKQNEVEEARESLGLLIVSGILLWKYFEGKKFGFKI